MDNKFILTILIVLIAMIIVSLVISIIFNNNKLYCKYFNRKEWNLWKKVIKKLKETETINVAKFDNLPNLNSFYINIEINSKKYKIIYWIKERAVSVHQDIECILSDFDKYHSDVAAKIIEEKIKKTLDNANESTKRTIEELMSE